MMNKLVSLQGKIKETLPQLTNARLASASTPFRKAPLKLRLKILNYISGKIFANHIENGEMEFLEDRYVNIEILELDQQYCLTLENDKVMVSDYNANPDATFKFSPIDGILIAAGEEDPDTLFFQRRLIVEGNTELGLEVKNFLGNIDLDDLPKLIKAGISLAAEKSTH